MSKPYYESRHMFGMESTEQQELDWIDEIDNLSDTLENVKREINRKWQLAMKYGFDEYADELAILLEKLDAFRKARE